MANDERPEEPNAAAPSSTADAPETAAVPDPDTTITAPASSDVAVSNPVASLAEKAIDADQEAESPPSNNTPALESSPTKPSLSKGLQSLASALPDLISSTSHSEIWGVTLADAADHIPTRIILQKYLNANDGDVGKAKDQLKKTLEWRAKTKPLELLERTFNKSKFGELGYVTVYERDRSAEAGDGAGAEDKEIFTWNIYGCVKDIDHTFGDLDEYRALAPSMSSQALLLWSLADRRSVCVQLHILAGDANGIGPPPPVPLHRNGAHHDGL